MADKKVTEAAAEVKAAAAEKVEKAVKDTKTAAKKTAAKAKTATKKAAATTKTAAKKTAAKAKTTAEKAKTAAKKAVENKQAVFVQYGDKEVAALDVLEAVKADFKANNGKKVIKTVKVYIKPEENTAYYVVNDNVTGQVAL